MKALAIDGATNTISFLAVHEDKEALLSLNISMKQSEKLLPSIEYVLNEVDLDVKDLEFLAVTQGPGTFTGLRLAFSALKALSLSFAIPLYAIPTLNVYAKPYALWEGAVIPAIDAKKKRFYTSLYRNGKKVFDDLDIEAKALVKKLDSEEKILCVGPDASLLIEALKMEDANLDLRNFPVPVAASIFDLMEMAYQAFIEKKPSLNDWEGPLYVRSSEAEENKQKQS